MKKILLVMVMISMLIAGTAFSQTINGPINTENGNGNLNAAPNAQSLAIGGTGGAGGNVTIGNIHPSASANVDNHNVNVGIVAPDITNRVNIDNNVNNRVNNKVNVKSNINNHNVNINDPTFNNQNVMEEGAIQNENTNIQGQLQNQRQIQEQNNNQQIAPTQTVTIKTDKPFANIPTTGVPELNFSHGTMVDVSRQLPKMKGVTLLRRGDEMTSIIDVTANVPFKKLYKTILSMAKDHAVQAPYLRFQIIMMEGQKSWTTGGSLIGGGTGILGTTGAAGSGSLIPSIGGTKANPLFTIVAMTVVPE